MVCISVHQCASVHRSHRRLLSKRAVLAFSFSLERERSFCRLWMFATAGRAGPGVQVVCGSRRSSPAAVVHCVGRTRVLGCAAT
eukprot:2926358-Rhodomonas_salina.1